MRSASFLFAFGLLAVPPFAAGCVTSVGACDMVAATAVVYDPEGIPAYEGQALIIRSCGGGGFCHSEGIEVESRVGAPLGLDFDLALASLTVEVEPDEVERLSRSQLNTFHLRNDIWQTIQLGTMPPPGELAFILEQADENSQTYQRIVPPARTGPPLPELSTPEGREIVRNWLACRTPVIERTEPRIDRGDNEIGATEASVETTPVIPVWIDDAGGNGIYERIIERRCASSNCHDDVDPEADLELVGSANSLFNLVNAPAAGTQCRAAGTSLVVPGDPDASLLIHKMEGVTDSGADVCGSTMPQSGNVLSAQRLAAVRQWIMDGAPERCMGACPPAPMP